MFNKEQIQPVTLMAPTFLSYINSTPNKTKAEYTANISMLSGDILKTITALTRKGTSIKCTSYPDLKSDSYINTITTLLFACSHTQKMQNQGQEQSEKLCRINPFLSQYVALLHAV